MTATSLSLVPKDENEKPWLLNFEVFVSTASNEVNMLKVNRKRFNLADYRNKAEFMEAANLHCVNKLGHAKDLVKPIFYYYDDNIFAGSGLTTRNDIDERVWEYLALEYEDDISMTIAFNKLYGQEADSINDCWKIAMKRCVGEFKDMRVFALDWIEREKIAKEDIPVMGFNIDTDSILEKLFVTHKTDGHWVFANKGGNGWGYFSHRDLEKYNKDDS